MTDAQTVILIIFAVIFSVVLIFNVVSYPNVKLYKKKYDELERGVYKYETSYGNSLYFYLYSYDINTLTFTRTNVNIIFFLDGDIKLTDNLYIHKSHLFLSLKDELVETYNIRNQRGRYEQSHHERYMKQKNKLDFKFFRG